MQISLNGSNSQIHDKVCGDNSFNKTYTGIQNLIREGKTNQIESVVQTGNKYGMKTMDMAISELYKKGAISMEIAMAYAVDREILKRFMIL